MIENPICIAGGALPPPSTDCEVDPAEPHPDEPGAPDDAPAVRPLDPET